MIRTLIVTAFRPLDPCALPFQSLLGELRSTPYTVRTCTTALHFPIHPTSLEALGLIIMNSKLRVPIPN